MIATFINSVLVLALLLPTAGPGGRFTSKANKNVACEISLAPAKVKAGSAGTLTMRLSPAKGIHINTTPEIELTVDTLNGLSWGSAPDVPKDAKSGYLQPKKPVTFRYAVGSGVPAGRYTMKGTVKYFYCSDAEGWCNRYAQPFELTITVTR